MRPFSIVAVGIASATLLGVASFWGGCSATQSSTDGGSTSSAGTPPVRPSGPVTTNTTTHNYALRKLFLGDSQTWKGYGYNLDGKSTTSASTDVCTRYADAPRNNQEDGTNGIDNSFGRNLMETILSLRASAQEDVNKALNDGTFTVMVVVSGWDQASAKFSATGLSTKLYTGGAFSDGGTKPTWTTADDWPVARSLLENPDDISSTKIKFADSYANNGTYVSGNPGRVALSLSFGGTLLDLNIEQAVMTMEVSGTSATNGRIAGVIETDKLVSALRTLGGRFATSLCTSSTFDSIEKTVRQASDMLSNGTNTAGQPCDALSVGLSFEATEIGVPTTVAAQGPVEADPCADAGGGDAGTGDSGH